MSEYHSSASVPNVLVYASAEPTSVPQTTPEPPKRAAASTKTIKLSPYEWFFGAMLLALFGVPLGFELYHLNPTPREIVTSQVMRLGGRIRFQSPSNAETTVTIDFSDRPIGNADLACLSQLASVDRLDLSHTSITDAGLRYVYELSALHELDLGHTAVTDAGLKALHGLRGLRCLSLTATRVTDAVVAELSALPELEELNLEYTDVGDDGLRRLAKCKCLKILHVGHTPVTDAAVKVMRAEHPGLQVFP